MIITLTWPMIATIITLVLAWNGFLLGLIRWSLKRNLKAFEEKLADVVKSSAQGKEDLTKLEKELAERLKRADLEAETNQRDQQCLLHKQDIKKFEETHVARLTDAELKVERIGAEIRNLPQHRHIQELSVRIEQIHGDVHEVSGSLKGISRAVDLMNEFLINRGGK